MSAKPLPAPPAPAIAGRTNTPTRPAFAPAGAAAAPQQPTPREEVIAFYRQYNPEKLSSINEILSKYQGQEAQLLAKLHKQYNVPMK
jgi:hypothetical protein